MVKYVSQNKFREIRTSIPVKEKLNITNYINFYSGSNAETDGHRAIQWCKIRRPVHVVLLASVNVLELLLRSPSMVLLLQRLLVALGLPSTTFLSRRFLSDLGLFWKLSLTLFLSRKLLFDLELFRRPPSTVFISWRVLFDVTAFGSRRR